MLDFLLSAEVSLRGFAVEIERVLDPEVANFDSLLLVETFGTSPTSLSERNIF